MNQTWMCAIILLLIPSTDACMRVSPPTPGIPAVPCKACAAEALHVKQKGETETAEPMTTDVTVTTGACAQRTLTCVGKDASIELFVDHVSVGSVMTPKDAASITATCNARGSWEYMGRVLSDVECSYAPAAGNNCKTCTYEQIQHLMRPGKGAKEFTEDRIYPKDPCAERTFKCDGRMAVIEVFGPGMEALGRVQGDALGDTAVFTVTCNADGTGWTAAGKLIVAVECGDAFLGP